MTDKRDSSRNTDARQESALCTKPKVIQETVDLMHTLMQNSHDPDVPIREVAPVDEVTLVPKEETFHAKFSRDRS